jgi:glycine cleavage system H protein
MTAKAYEIPDDCSYSESDEWVRVENGVARIGITDFAQSQLSDIVFVELPEVGSQIEQGQPFGVVESVKAVSDLLAPISGEIVEVNRALEEHPERVNEEPYGRGWLVAVAPEDLEALEALLNPAQYRKSVEERSAE